MRGKRFIRFIGQVLKRKMRKGGKYPLKALSKSRIDDTLPQN